MNKIGFLSLSILIASCSQAPVRTTITKKSSDARPGEEYIGDKVPTGSPTTEGGPVVNNGSNPPILVPTSGETPTPSAPLPLPAPPPPVVPVVIDQAPSTHMDAAFISSFIDDIAGRTGAGRGTGSAENKAVAQRIADEFKTLGFKAGGDNSTYFQAFDAKGKATQNIIGILPGETDEYIVMGAHMDHLGTTNGQIFYGADDNASGTTGLLASARAFAKNTAKTKRGIIFIAFSGEEMGLLGSLHYVKAPTVDIKKIKFMVNMDMIGRYRDEMEILGLELTIEGNSITRELLGKTNLKGKFLAEVSAGGSDHMPFKTIGIPTGTFHTKLHPEYHKVTDTLALIDKSSLKTIAGIAADLAYRLAKAEKITSAKFALVPIPVDGYKDDLHGHSGCEPGLASFEDVVRNLEALQPIR